MRFGFLDLLSIFEGGADTNANLACRHLYNLVELNHDLQVRFKWQAGSLAVWDNRSNFHAATVRTLLLPLFALPPLLPPYEY